MFICKPYIIKHTWPTFVCSFYQWSTLYHHPYSLMTLNILRSSQILLILSPYKMHLIKKSTGATLMTCFSMNLNFSIFALERTLVYINGTPIVRSNCVKDLGVHISSSGKSSTHCEIILSNACKNLGLICRTFSMHCTIAKKLLYLTLAQSRLTYCSQIWRPHLLKYISVLERVQRRAKKYKLEDYHWPYRCRLISLDLLPLM